MRYLIRSKQNNLVPNFTTINFPREKFLAKYNDSKFMSIYSGQRDVFVPELY